MFLQNALFHHFVQTPMNEATDETFYLDISFEHMQTNLQTQLVVLDFLEGFSTPILSTTSSKQIFYSTRLFLPQQEARWSHSRHHVQGAATHVVTAWVRPRWFGSGHQQQQWREWHWELSRREWERIRNFGVLGFLTENDVYTPFYFLSWFWAGSVIKYFPNGLPIFSDPTQSEIWRKKKNQFQSRANQSREPTWRLGSCPAPYRMKIIWKY